MMNPYAHDFFLPGQVALTSFAAAYLLYKFAQYTFHTGSKNWLTTAMYVGFLLTCIFRIAYAGYLLAKAPKYI